MKTGRTLFKSDFKKYFDKIRYAVFKIVTSPYLLSGLISIIIIISLPEMFRKYTAEIVQRNKLQSGQIFYYADLNSDGISEQIEFHQIKKDFFYITVSENQKVINQWNFQGNLLPTAKLPVNHVRKDSLKTFYFFVYKNRKIYLNGLNAFKKKFTVQNKFVSDFYPRENNLDCYPKICGFYDTDKDGVSNLYFYLNATYSKQPRNVYVYNPAKDSIISSTQSYASLTNSVITDTTNHNLNLLFATYATGNSSIHKPYSDMFSWIMCFDKNLSFKFHPIKIGYYPSLPSVAILSINGNKYYAVMNIYNGMANHLCSLRIYNSDFKLIREEKFHFTKRWLGAILFRSPNRKYFYVIKKDGEIDKMDNHFQIITRIHLPPLNNPVPLILAYKANGQKKLVFLTRNLQNLLIVNTDFSNYVSIPYQGNEGIFYSSFILTKDKSTEYAVSSKNVELIISYRYNPLYYFKYPAYAGIYIIILSFFLLIEKGQKHRAELKYETERKIAGLQLQSIKSQMDPHFTLNILNSIGSLNYKQDRDNADYVFGKYSKLLRMTILRSDKILTTLSEELDYVKNYLELEQYRCNNKFTWKIDVEEGINTDIKIPKMLIHTFVENTIKHGLRHLEKDGELVISVTNQSNKYLVTVRDNGIGREKAKKVELKNTGKGLNILGQILDLYESLMKVRITYYISDLIDKNEKTSGTEVLIKIPVTNNE